MRKSERKQLDEFLTTRDKVRLSDIREHVSRMWARGDPLHPTFTLHGREHCQQVERLIGHILAPEHPDHHRLEDVLDAQHLFILLAAAWLHDIGMILPPTEVERDEASRQGVPLPDLVRMTHNSRLASYIFDHASELRFQPHEADFVVAICRAHRGLPIGADPQLTESPTNTRLLAAVLRAADELDISSARTPPELAELVWHELDDTARWHWLKHICVPVMEPSHDERKDRTPSMLSLSYDIIVRLPDVRYLIEFRDRVMRPIRDVIDRQDVNLILRQKGLEICCDRFQWIPQLAAHVLSPNISISEAEVAAVMSGSSQLPEVRDARNAIDQLRSRNAAICEIVQRQFQRLIQSLTRQPEHVKAVALAAGQYFSDLLGSSTIEDCTGSFERFNDACRKLRRLYGSDPHDGVTLEKEGLKLSYLGFRCMCFVLGDETAKLQQFSHLQMWLGGDVAELAHWIVSGGGRAELKQLAVSGLGDYGSAEHYAAVLEASRDPDPAVRICALRGLGRLCGPGTLERLVEVLKFDLDGEVRSTAREVLARLTEQSSPDDDYPGSKVMLLDEEPGFIPPLIDALTKRKIEVRVSLDHESLAGMLRDWGPDVVVCELFPISTARKPLGGLGQGAIPGIFLARAVRHALPSVPIILTSVIDPESIATELLPLACIYVRKPTTVDHLARTVCSVIGARRLAT